MKAWKTDDKDYYIKHQVFDLVRKSREYGLSEKITIKHLHEAISEMFEKLQAIHDGHN
jgi:hypothetical protein